MRFCEASAKDNFNVDEIFLKLVDDILSKVGANTFSPPPQNRTSKSFSTALALRGWTLVIQPPQLNNNWAEQLGEAEFPVIFRVASESPVK